VAPKAPMTIESTTCKTAGTVERVAHSRPIS
jgi:hypothetical protein